MIQTTQKGNFFKMKMVTEPSVLCYILGFFLQFWFTLVFELIRSRDIGITIYRNMTITLQSILNYTNAKLCFWKWFYSANYPEPKSHPTFDLYTSSLLMIRECRTRAGWWGNQLCGRQCLGRGEMGETLRFKLFTSLQRCASRGWRAIDAPTLAQASKLPV